MNVFQYAIITTANAMQPGEQGYESAQRLRQQTINRLSKKRGLLDLRAAQMREQYLNSGIGCKTRAKVIAERTGGPPEPPHLPRD